MSFWRDNFTDYNNVTWEIGAFYIGISLCSLLLFQAIDVARGHVFNPFAFGGAVSAILTSFGVYKIGDAMGRRAADNAGEGAPTADPHVTLEPDQRGEAGV